MSNWISGKVQRQGMCIIITFQLINEDFVEGALRVSCRILMQLGPHVICTLIHSKHFPHELLVLIN